MKRFVVFAVSLVVCLAFALGLPSAGKAAPAKPKAKTDIEKINEGASRGDVALILRMLKANPSMVNARDGDGASPLHWAADKGQTAAARALLDGKADVNAKKKNGVTPLHIAAAKGHRALVELLLERKADPNLKDDVLRTPMTVAKINKHEEIAALLSPVTEQATVSAEDPKPPATPAATPAPTPAVQTPPEYVAMAKKLVLSMEKGEFREVYDSFNEKMKSMVSQEQLKQIWDGLIAKEGAMKRISDSTAQNVEQNGERFDVIVVSCEFPKRWRNWQVAVDANQKVAGLFLLPSGAMDD